MSLLHFYFLNVVLLLLLIMPIRGYATPITNTSESEFRAGTINQELISEVFNKAKESYIEVYVLRGTVNQKITIDDNPLKTYEGGNRVRIYF